MRFIQGRPEGVSVECLRGLTKEMETMVRLEANKVSEAGIGVVGNEEMKTRFRQLIKHYPAGECVCLKMNSK